MKNQHGTMIKQPGTIKNNENRAESMKNYENRPGKMKNQPGTMKTIKTNLEQ